MPETWRVKKMDNFFLPELSGYMIEINILNDVQI